MCCGAAKGRCERGTVACPSDAAAGSQRPLLTSNRHPIRSLLAQQAGLGDLCSSERRRWTQRAITSAFAEPADVAALSRRFGRHGERQLDVDVWTAIAKANSEHLAQSPRFREISLEVRGVEMR